jgi:trans-aconitate methyltransferase
VQAQLAADRKVNILSYGCSTSDEVFSLRRYFPHTTIKGLDINRANIAVCRRRLRAAPDAGMAFETAASTQAEPSSAYDAIFAMAVLRHGSLALPGVTRCDHLICLPAPLPISSGV